MPHPEHGKRVLMLCEAWLVIRHSIKNTDHSHLAGVHETHPVRTGSSDKGDRDVTIRNELLEEDAC